jgi:hypothetical protein
VFVFMLADLETLADLALNGHYTRPSKVDIEKYLASPAAVQLAGQLYETICALILAAPAADRVDLFRRMPSYHILLALAYGPIKEIRKASAQRENARKARSPSYPIGPDVWESVAYLCPDVTVPPHIKSPARLPRTLSGFIEEQLRRYANLQNNVPTLWRWLAKHPSLSVALVQPRELNFRSDS